MSYGQKNYPQIQGINGRYAISSIGCFVTAFCNLEEDFGNPIDPASLNNYFVNHGTYVDVDDGVRDDLGWGSVTAFDNLTQVSNSADHGTEQSAGWPASNKSIVRFYYRSISHPTLPNGQPNMIFHFCKVADPNNHTIVDSWDGITKFTPYGEPTAWATYNHNVPVPVTSIDKPVVIKPAPEPIPIPVVTAPPNGASTADSPLYGDIVVPIKGYSNATAAANHDLKFQGLDIQPGSHYFLFTSKYGMDNITLVSGEPGSWINPADNVLKPIVVTPAPEPEPLPPIEDDDVTKWKASYVPLRNDAKMVKYVLLHDLPVSDLSGKGPDMHLRKYQEIGIYGTFVKEQVKYWRPKLAKDVHFDLWYGIKLLDENGEPTMEEEQAVYNPETTALERKALHTSKPGDIPVVVIGSVERFLEDGVKLIDGIVARVTHRKVKK